MVDVTDVHFRVLVRLLSSSAHLYTPMIPDLAAVARPHLLHSHPPTPPLHLQLAGSSLSTLLLATSLLPSPSPYASINANAGCPAPSAQAGHWGAALMLDPTYPTTLAHLHSASPLPLTLKCRIGVGPTPPHYPTFSAFIHRMRREAGVRHFIVHCRPALLHLSPALNRSVPQLDYSFAERVKEELGDEAWVEVNGGVDCEAKVQRWIASRLDGVMIGRWAYQAVFDMRHVDRWTRQWTIERRRRQRGRTEHSTERGAEVGRGEAEGEGEGEERLEADDASPPADAVCRYEVTERYCDYLSGVDGRLLGNDVGRLVRPLLSLWAGEQGCKEWRKQLTAGVSAGLGAVDTVRRAMDGVDRVRRATAARATHLFIPAPERTLSQWRGETGEVAAPMHASAGARMVYDSAG